MASTAAIIIGTTVFFALLGGHFFRWNVLTILIDERGNLRTVLRYVYGVGCIGLGYTAWVLINADRLVALEAIDAFWVMALAAGLGTVVGYGVDAIIERRVKRVTGRGENIDG
jgi:hypothetical protein